MVKMGTPLVLTLQGGGFWPLSYIFFNKQAGRCRKVDGADSTLLFFVTDRARAGSHALP